MWGNALLRGEKVYLNSLEQDDLPALIKWYQDLDALANIRTSALKPQSAAETRQWLESLPQSKNFEFAIRLIDTGDLIGMTLLKSLDWKNRVGEFGIWIGEAAQRGQGYSKDTAHIMLRYGFDELNLNRIELKVGAWNEYAIRSYEKVGFQHEVRWRGNIYRDGNYHDTLSMSILRHEWQAQQKG